MNLRAIAVTCLVVLGTHAASAGQVEDVLRAMDECAGKSDKDARLACYDLLGPQVKTAIARLPRSGPPTAEEQKSWFGFDFGNLFGESAPSQQTTPEKFGSDTLAPAPQPQQAEAPIPEAIDSISAKVTELAFSPFGKAIVFLDNGQVWRQLEADTERVTLSKRGGDTVIVQRGLLGSYIMHAEDSKRTFKVKRIK